MIDSFKSGESGKVCIGFNCYKQLNNLSCTIKIKELGGDGGDLLYITTKHTETTFDVESGFYELNLIMPTMILGPGVYTTFVRIFYDSIKTLKIVENFIFKVSTNGQMSQSRLYQPHKWELELIDKEQ